MGLKILIIDDEDDVRTFLRMMLAVEGADVMDAADGPSGIALAGEFHPDIVVMDYMMPEMSGADAAERIRELRPGAWIVSFSGVDQRFPWADHQVSKGPSAYDDLLAAIQAA